MQAGTASQTSNFKRQANKMTIFEAIQKTIDEAKNTGKLMRLYRRQSGYLVSSQYWDDWLFLAYPGGRKILSKEGNNILQAERY